MRRHREQVGDLCLADKFRRKRHPLLFNEAITGALGGVEAALAFGTLDPRINDRAQFGEMIWRRINQQHETAGRLSSRECLPHRKSEHAHDEVEARLRERYPFVRPDRPEDIPVALCRRLHRPFRDIDPREAVLPWPARLERGSDRVEIVAFAASRIENGEVLAAARQFDNAGRHLIRNGRIDVGVEDASPRSDHRLAVAWIA